MTNGNYAITFLLDVTHAGLLWDAAAARATTTGSMNAFEVIDTIGPRDDPGVADCLAMLFDPSVIPGCRPVAWSCVPDNCPARSDAPPTHPAGAIITERSRSATPALSDSPVAC